MSDDLNRYPLTLYKIASANNDGSFDPATIVVENRAEENSALRKGWRERSNLKDPAIRVWLLTKMKPFITQWGWLGNFIGGIITGVIGTILKQLFF